MLMMKEQFLCASANITQLDPKAEGVPIVREFRDNVPLKTVMSNSFGFGGTNSTLIFQQLDD
jgi:3-oxoacyl-[acyl-carrier-protein] synthase-1